MWFYFCFHGYYLVNHSVLLWHSCLDRQTQTSLYNLAHTQTDVVCEVLLRKDALLVKGMFVLGQNWEKEIKSEREAQRGGVTETITVIPCFAAWRYALHHSSFILSLASLLGVYLPCGLPMSFLFVYLFVCFASCFSACLPATAFSFFLNPECSVSVHRACCSLSCQSHCLNSVLLPFSISCSFTNLSSNLIAVIQTLIY